MTDGNWHSLMEPEFTPSDTPRDLLKTAAAGSQPRFYTDGSEPSHNNSRWDLLSLQDSVRPIVGLTHNLPPQTVPEAAVRLARLNVPVMVRRANKKDIVVDSFADTEKALRKGMKKFNKAMRGLPARPSARLAPSLVQPIESRVGALKEYRYSDHVAVGYRSVSLIAPIQEVGADGRITPDLDAATLQGFTQREAAVFQRNGRSIPGLSDEISIILNGTDNRDLVINVSGTDLTLASAGAQAVLTGLEKDDHLAAKIGRLRGAGAAQGSKIERSTAVMIGPDHVLTAAHAVMDDSNDWHQWLDFVPGLHGDVAPVQRVRVKAGIVPDLYLYGRNSEQKQFDFAVLLLDRLSDGTSVGDHVGWLGMGAFTDINRLLKAKVQTRGYGRVLRPDGTWVFDDKQRADHGKLDKVKGGLLLHELSTETGDSGGAVLLGGSSEPLIIGVIKDGSRPENINRAVHIDEKRIKLICQWLEESWPTDRGG